ncbi:hypothetical protein OIU84_007278 [Salix udensis]|uniref:Uncharacterized protein n=1 Tax=Salix udensis TaxID=889485 RepID=A0AAD6NZA8_9ROSI|nr:hypothetical protein OIU84_007278 [Salix udensis]
MMTKLTDMCRVWNGVSISVHNNDYALKIMMLSCDSLCGI